MKRASITLALAMAELMRTGCTLTTDHHYVYPTTFRATPWRSSSRRPRPRMRFSPTRLDELSKKDGDFDTVVQTEQILHSEDSIHVSRRSADAMQSRPAPAAPFRLQRN